jgi:hypothetical protein
LPFMLQRLSSVHVMLLIVFCVMRATDFIILERIIIQLQSRQHIL